MKKSPLLLLVAGGVVVAATGVVLAVASGGSSTREATVAGASLAASPTTPAAPAAPSGAAGRSGTPTSAPATAKPSSGGGNGGSAAGPCEDVFLASAPSGDVVGRLCTTVAVKGKRPTGATVTFTSARNCTGTVRIRLSGVDTGYAEWALHATRGCAAGKATAKFTIAVKVPSGTEVCGMLESEDRFAAALTCVPVG